MTHESAPTLRPWSHYQVEADRLEAAGQLLSATSYRQWAHERALLLCPEAYDLHTGLAREYRATRDRRDAWIPR